MADNASNRRQKAAAARSVAEAGEKRRERMVRIVGAVANSILQGSLLISEAAFTEKFPGESGYRMFLIDAPSNDALSATLTRALQDVGFELTFCNL